MHLRVAFFIQLLYFMCLLVVHDRFVEVVSSTRDSFFQRPQKSTIMALLTALTKWLVDHILAIGMRCVCVCVCLCARVCVSVSPSWRS